MYGKIKTLRSKFIGTLLATAIADAIGELAFTFKNKKRLLEAIEKAPLLRYTDDTVMMIGVAEALCQDKKIDIEKLGSIFLRNYEVEPWRGYGRGPIKIFSLIRRGYSFKEAPKMLFGGRGSFGNGAAMRVMPVGLLFFDSPRLYEEAVKSAEPTHTHPLAKDAAALLAKAIAEAITLRFPQGICVEKFCRKLKDFSKTEELKRKLSFIPELILKNVSHQEAKDSLGTTVTAQDSVPFAIYIFLKNKYIFKDCLFEAVLSGGDRDTIGAMSCAISGAYLGMEALPKEWIEKLENNSYIKDLAVRLWRLKDN